MVAKLCIILCITFISNRAYCMDWDPLSANGIEPVVEDIIKPDVSFTGPHCPVEFAPFHEEEPLRLPVLASDESTAQAPAQPNISDEEATNLWCSECNRPFSTIHCLIRHKQRLHNPKNPFRCPFCTWNFCDLNPLGKHLKRRHGKKPLPSELEKELKTAAASLLQNEYHEPIRKIKRRIKSQNSQNHKDRIPVLGGLPCPLCTTSRPATQDALNKHINLYHDTTKPFECDLDTCGWRFAQKGNLKWHKKKMHDFKPYACTKCNKSYHHKSALTEHNRIKHQED